VWDEARRTPELGLPAHLTLQLFEGDEAIFSSGKHWLLPLFDLDEFFDQSGHDPARTRLVDRVTGRAAALMVARLGIPELHTLLLSRRAIPVLEQHGIRYGCRELVDQILCTTETLFDQDQDLDAVWSHLQERRLQAASAVGMGQR
jgi:Domain of unknown function (DUF1893)